MDRVEKIKERIAEIETRLQHTSEQIKKIKQEKYEKRMICDSKERQKISQELSRVLTVRESLKSEKQSLLASLREISDSNSSSLTA